MCGSVANMKEELVKIGIHFREEKQLDKSEQVFKDILESDPSFTKALSEFFILALQHRHSKNTTKACDIFIHILKLDKNYTQAQEELFDIIL